MSTPAYFPPSIGPSGLQLPTYQAILADNLQAYLNIYGTNQYIAPDSAIYQLLSILSLKQADVNLALQLAYNQSSPQTAVGAGLDRQVKMNGLARESFSFSFASLTLTGAAGTPVANGAAQDQNGNIWTLPPTVTIVGGSVTVIAVCTTPGAVTAEPGTIDIINTPTAGWSGVTNANPATAGEPVETDSKLRARQSISVALPATTPIASTIALVLATPGVVRVAPGYPTPGGPGTSIENPTGGVDSWGNPPHSISIVAECSDTLAVAQAIYNKKTIGCFTNGTTSVPVKDPTTGVVETISFFLPMNLAIFVRVVLVGYGSAPTSSALAAVNAALVAYLNALAIGETVSIGALYFEVMGVNTAIAAPTFGTSSLQVGTGPTTAGFFGVNVPTLTVTGSTTGIAVGQMVCASGIASGTVVSAISGGVVTLSQNTLAVGDDGTPIGFANLGTVDVPMPNFYYAALGEAINMVVLS